MVGFMSSPKNPISKLLEVLKVVRKLERGSGFSQYLGLTQHYFDNLASTGQLHFDTATKTLTSRLPIRKHQQHVVIHQDGTTSSSSSSFPVSSSAPPFHHGSSSVSPWNVSLSTYQAMMDDVTTWALVLADPQRGRAGVSVNLQSAWCLPPPPVPIPKTSNTTTPVQRDDEEVTLMAKVDKVRNNLGFVSSQVRTLQGDLVCTGTHIKYLPMGLVMDFLQSSRGWPVAQLYAKYRLPDPPIMSSSELPVSLLESLEFETDNRALFSVTPGFASLGGPIHGGCQAMLMEVVATRFLEHQQPPQRVQLHSMSVDYLSSPNRHRVEVVVEDAATNPIASSSIGGLIPVHVSLQGRDGRQYSRGVLQFYSSVGMETLFVPSSPAPPPPVHSRL